MNPRAIVISRSGSVVGEADDGIIRDITGCVSHHTPHVRPDGPERWIHPAGLNIQRRLEHISRPPADSVPHSLRAVEVCLVPTSPVAGCTVRPDPDPENVIAPLERADIRKTVWRIPIHRPARRNIGEIRRNVGCLGHVGKGYCEGRSDDDTKCVSMYFFHFRPPIKQDVIYSDLYAPYKQAKIEPKQQSY